MRYFKISVIINYNQKSLIEKEHRNMKQKINEIKKLDISKSQKMVQLYNLGLEVKQIAEIIGTRYNFVYNVVSNYCRMNDLEMRKATRENKKAKIIELVQAGKTNVEISKELKVSYHYVFNTRKAYEAAK